MAGVQYKKLKSRIAIKAKIRHCDPEKRLANNHANKNIDKSLTHTNLQLKDRDYQTVCDVYDQTMNHLNSLPHPNKAKGIVLGFGLDIPAPLGLDDDKDGEDFFNRVCEIVAEQYGYDNILEAYYHRDEIHDYIDEDGNTRTSRPHVHVYVLPVQYNEKYEHERLNGKWFSKRSNMNKLNNSIHKMCKKEYGLAFMDGSKRKSNKTVEQLKNESDERRIEAESRAKEIIQEAEAQADAFRTSVFAEIAGFKQEVREIIDETQNRLKTANNELEAIDQKIYDAGFMKWVSTIKVKGEDIQDYYKNHIDTKPDSNHTNNHSNDRFNQAMSSLYRSNPFLFSLSDEERARKVNSMPPIHDPLVSKDKNQGPSL